VAPKIRVAKKNVAATTPPASTAQLPTVHPATKRRPAAVTTTAVKRVRATKATEMTAAPVANMDVDANLDAAYTVRTIGGTHIRQRCADKYFDATAMCKAAGKPWATYSRKKQTHSFMQATAAALGLPAEQLFEVTQGGKHQGTWIHPHLVYHLAQWISADFAVSISGWLNELADTLEVNPLGPVTVGAIQAPAVAAPETGPVEDAPAVAAPETGPVEDAPAVAAPGAPVAPDVGVLQIAAPAAVPAAAVVDIPTASSAEPTLADWKRTRVFLQLPGKNPGDEDVRCNIRLCDGPTEEILADPMFSRGDILQALGVDATHTAKVTATMAVTDMVLPTAALTYMHKRGPCHRLSQLLDVVTAARTPPGKVFLRTLADSGLRTVAGDVDGVVGDVVKFNAMQQVLEAEAVATGRLNILGLFGRMVRRADAGLAAPAIDNVRASTSADVLVPQLAGAAVADGVEAVLDAEPVRVTTVPRTRKRGRVLSDEEVLLPIKRALYHLGLTDVTQALPSVYVAVKMLRFSTVAEVVAATDVPVATVEKWVADGVVVMGGRTAFLIKVGSTNGGSARRAETLRISSSVYSSDTIMTGFLVPGGIQAAVEKRLRDILPLCTNLAPAGLPLLSDANTPVVREEYTLMSTADTEDTTAEVVEVVETVMKVGRDIATDMAAQCGIPLDSHGFTGTATGGFAFELEMSRLALDTKRVDAEAESRRLDAEARRLDAEARRLDAEAGARKDAQVLELQRLQIVADLMRNTAVSPELAMAIMRPVAAS
jgi:hypothetical protein